MNNNLKNKIVISSFFAFLLVFTLINLSFEDNDISYEERRKLKQLPNISIKGIFSGNYFEDFEEYALDQFVFRNEFRNLKSSIDLSIFNKNDNNDFYKFGEYIIKKEYPLNEKSVYNASEIYNKIKQVYFKDSNVYFTIVPDKNYFVPENKNYLSIDYNKLINIMKNNTKDIKYIDIINKLKITDYYKTDIHWKQEEIIKIGDILLTSMSNNKKSSDYDYSLKCYNSFKGSYYGQYGMSIKSEELKYLTNNIIDEARVYDYENQSYDKIYNEKYLNNVDSYDIFLSGAKPLLKIENANNNTKKELYIFKDSFGSSLAPLLLSEYSEIYLVDLRYITFEQLSKYIQPSKDSDVLLMYNTLILNNSSIISR